uniref:Uncharacterized protein n=1 Tax=Panagrolaimus sp. JU765 TaxID=591449 RepID=A0AC34QYP4_9BILA
MQNITAPESCGLNFQGSAGHPSSAGSLHPASAGNMIHTYPNSAGNMGTPQMPSTQMHSVQNSSWSVDMAYPPAQPQDLMFPLPATQNPQMEMAFQQPEPVKEQPKPKRPAKKKKSEKPAFPPPPKYPTMPANSYEQTAFTTPFLPYNNVAIASQMGAGPPYYGNYNQQAACYGQNAMQWAGNPAYAASYGNFMNTQFNQQQRFYPTLQTYPILPGSSHNPGTIPTPMSWQRPQAPATNPQSTQFYNNYSYYPYPT